MKMLKNIGPLGVKFTSEYLVGIKFSEQNGSRKSLYEDQVLKKKNSISFSGINSANSDVTDYGVMS